MTSIRALALASALMTASAVAANAQAPWPSTQPQQSAWPSSAPQPQSQSQSAWPSNGPPAQPQPQAQPQTQPQPQQQAGWPSSSAPAAPPQQAPWPAASAPSGPPMAGPPIGSPMGGGGMGPRPTAEQQECITNFTALRTEAENRGQAAKLVSEKKPPSREDLCKAVTALTAAQLKWAKYVESNIAKCGIPKEIVTQLKMAHAKTAQGQKQICAAGPAGGQVAAPTLSDALGTATLPTHEPEKRKPGGTLDTLTGNALAR